MDDIDAGQLGRQRQALAARGLAGRLGRFAGGRSISAGIVSGTLGELTELHFFGHIALALVIVAWFKISWRSLFWLGAAVAWMPVFGWWLANFSGGAVFTLRLLLALAGTICLWPQIKMQSET